MKIINYLSRTIKISDPSVVTMSIVVDPTTPTTASMEYQPDVKSTFPFGEVMTISAIKNSPISDKPVKDVYYVVPAELKVHYNNREDVLCPKDTVVDVDGLLVCSQFLSRLDF